MYSCCDHPQCPKRLQSRPPPILLDKPPTQQKKKWTKMQRLRIGVYRFSKHALCAPVYLLCSSAALLQCGFVLFIMGTQSSLYEGVVVLVAAPFIGAAAVATITILVALLPIKSMIDAFRAEDPQKEDLDFPFKIEFW